MSGHSKWANIRVKKGKVDAQRGAAFTRLAKEIIAAARAGGGDPNNNLRLRNAIDKARAGSMPKENIERSLKRGTGELEGVQYEEVTYEGYGPGGVAVMVQCLTDNRNRTAPEVRSAFRASGGAMGENGCVSYLFDHRGVILVSTEEGDEDTIMMAALEAGAEDVKAEDSEVYEIYTAPNDVYTVKAALEAAGIAVQDAEARMVPQTMVSVTGKEAQQVMRLLEKLEDDDDVQNVYANADFSEEDLAGLA
jgi:YebC/PmpR family DNA-binding regulatory protein